ncbi:MAG: hypothetical protein R3E95_12915 [Thiolinea sp.]
MIGLDTNVLARYYIEDADDQEAQTQRLAAKALLESGQALKVSKTVILEFEWVLRGVTASPLMKSSRFTSTCSASHTYWSRAVQKLKSMVGLQDGLDFADALHHANYHDCEAMASFDDRKFARKVKRMGLARRASLFRRSNQADVPKTLTSRF